MKRFVCAAAGCFGLVLVWSPCALMGEEKSDVSRLNDTLKQAVEAAQRVKSLSDREKLLDGLTVGLTLLAHLLEVPDENQLLVSIDEAQALIGDELATNDKAYSDVEVLAVETGGLRVSHGAGVATIAPLELPEELARALGYSQTELDSMAKETQANALREAVSKLPATQPVPMHTTEGKVPKEVMDQIIAEAERRFPSDFDMQEYIINKQVNAYFAVQSLKLGK